MDRSDTLAADPADSADTALSQAWSRGDADALTRIVERHGALVHARCRRALPDSDADDATQAVFLVLARRGSQAAHSPVLAAWLLRVADNVVRNALRDQRRRRSAERAAAQAAMGENAALPAAEPPPEREIIERLGQALERLRPVEREAIQLHYLAGCSLAEVARASSSGLSTVKERIGRGLERLRTDLERAGCACALPAIANGLSAAAPQLLPSQCARIFASLRRPAHEIPPRIRRWMRQGPSMTAMLTSAAAAVLLVGGAALQCTIHAADHGAPGAPATAVVPPSTSTDAAAQAEDFYTHLDPEKARTWLTVRWMDGRRTAERLKSLPEIALLPDQGVAILAKIASLRDASLSLCMDSLLPAQVLKQQYRLLATTSRMTLQQRLDSTSKLMELQLKDAHPGQSPYTTATMIFHLRAHGSAADAPAITWLLGLPQRAGGADKSGTSTAPLAAPLSLPAALHRTTTDATVCIDSADSAEVAIPASLLATCGDDDLLACHQLDDGHGHLRRTSRVSLQVRSTGLHLDVDAPLVQTLDEASEGPAVVASRDDLARVPGDALLACGMAASQAPSHTTAPWITILHVMRVLADLSQAGSHPSPLVAFGPTIGPAILKALDHANGQLLLFVQPGLGMPVLTVELDMPKPACDDLVKALGHPVAEDGSTTFPLQMVVAALGWRDGHLIFTTHPGGLDSCVGQSGFTKEPEVAAALAAMPAGPCSCFAVMRPAAFVGTIAPFLGLIAPQVAGQVPAYQARLQASQSYAFFASVNTPQGVHEEASGLLAGVAGAYLFSQMKTPSAIN